MTRAVSPLLERRQAGVLLHPTSLPDTRFGALGRAAFHFIDWLAVGGFSVWQVLPLGPVGEDRSPYFACSNHAGEPGLIDLELLVQDSLLDHSELDRFDRSTLLTMAVGRLLAAPSGLAARFATFEATEAHWLEDFALYQALQQKVGGAPWWEWPEALRGRDPSALRLAAQALAEPIREIKVQQFFFHSQWQGVRRYAGARGVTLFGDLPMYLAPDSVETWVHPELFELDRRGRPVRVAGVPPDYFSEDGQRWGNPLYRWEVHQATDFAWWIERLRAQFALYDIVRIDHFRGLEAYWAIPAEAETARSGEWCEAPGMALFSKIREVLGPVALVAEDLGVITDAVVALRDHFDLPGIRVAQFGFDDLSDNVHVPYRWSSRVVGYTGTHDNNTTVGWLGELSPEARGRLCEYLAVAPEHLPLALVRLVLSSVATLAVIPMQDLLTLGADARMNRPGTVGGNWDFRFSWAEVPSWLGDQCRRWNDVYGRVS